MMTSRGGALKRRDLLLKQVRIQPIPKFFILMIIACQGVACSALNCL